MMKRLYINDFVLNLIIVVLCLVLPVVLSVMGKNEDKTVVVTFNGEIVKECRLDENVSFSPDGGKTLVKVENGKAYIEKSDCPDGLCMDMKKAQNNGDSVVCVPNKVTVTVKSQRNDETGADVIAG